jgi:hypothetical protein
MVQTLPIAKNITTIRQAEDIFKLRPASDDSFFTEWFDDLPELSSAEKESLNRIKKRYLYQRKNGPLTEGVVNYVVMSPLLELAGFYDPPFLIRSEPSVEIAVEDSDTILKGRIDVLVVQDQLWVLVVESKQTSFNIDVAVPQALAYMTSNPQPDRPTYGLVSNGGYFMFVKVVNQSESQYALSDDFSLYRRRNELFDVLSVLKQIGKLITLEDYVAK